MADVEKSEFQNEFKTAEEKKDALEKKPIKKRIIRRKIIKKKQVIPSQDGITTSLLKPVEIKKTETAITSTLKPVEISKPIEIKKSEAAVTSMLKPVEIKKSEAAVTSMLKPVEIKKSEAAVTSMLKPVEIKKSQAAVTSMLKPIEIKKSEAAVTSMLKPVEIKKSQAAVTSDEDIKDQEESLKRKVIKKKVITRKLDKKMLAEYLPKKIQQAKEEKNEQQIEIDKKEAISNNESSIVAWVESKEQKNEIEQIALDSDTGPRMVKRRVIKRRPAIKRVIKKKAITRKLARETVEEILGKKLGTEIKKDTESEVIHTKLLPAENIPEIKKQELIKTEDEFKTRFTAREIIIPENWKENKISFYKKRSEDNKPAIEPQPEESLLNGRYRILEIINSDAHGHIYKVIDLKEKQGDRDPYKILKEIQFLKPNEGTKKLLEERTEVLKKLSSFIQDVNHPNLSKIYGYFFEGDEKQGAKLFLIIEYIEGKTIKELLKNYQKNNVQFPAKTIFNIIQKTSDILSYLHNKKPFPIAFGDLKLSNIILTNEEEIKFINYGIGGICYPIIDPSDYRGHIGYSAPEQKGLDFTSIKADIFSFGGTLYYLLTDVIPEENPYDFKYIKEIKPYISSNVQDLVFNCLKVNPNERPNIEKIKEQIKDIKLIDLDTSTDEMKKLEEKKKRIASSEIKIIEPIVDIITENVTENEKISFYKTDTFYIILLSITIIVFLIIIWIKFNT